MLPNFLQNLLQNSAVLSAAILLLTVLTRTLRHKTPPRLRLYCWLLVAAGLLLPVRPTLYTVTVPEPVAASLSETVAGVFDAGVAEPSQLPPPPAGGAESKTPGPAGVTESKTPGPAGPPSLRKRAGMENETEALPTPFAEGGLGWIPIVWAAGALGLLALLAARHIRFRLALRRWSRPAEDAAPLAEVCAAVRLRRIPRLLVCPLVVTPVVVGLFRPVFILPDEEIPPERLRLMLLHEAVHCKRGDLWAKLLSLAALTVHWFNPLVHLLNRAVVTETELACDAAVLRTLGEGERIAYGQTILSAARRTQRVTALSSAFSSGGGKSLKRRLRAIVERRKTRRAITLLCTLLLLGSLLCGLLASCSGIELDYVEEDGEITADTGEGIGDTPESVGEEPPAEPIVEAPVDTEAKTDSLTLYIPDLEYWITGIETALEEYQKAYPEVEVTAEYIGNGVDPMDWRATAERYVSRVATEVMAGAGPDVIVVFKDFFPDLHRTIDNGAFLNLNAFVEQDTEFDMSPLNSIVMDAGIYKGGRYLMPYSYFVPTLYGLQSKLDAVGFDAAQVTDFSTLFEQMDTVLPKARENLGFVGFFSADEDYSRVTIGVLSPSEFLPSALRAADLRLIDYERETVLPDEAGLSAFCEAYKLYWQSWEPGTVPPSGSYVHFLDQSLLDYSPFFMISPLTNVSFAKGLGYEDDSALLPFRGLDGGLTAEIDCALAVGANSQNQRNAWNFVKTMYAFIVQSGRRGTGPSYGIPVHQMIMRRNYRQMFDNVVGIVMPDAIGGTMHEGARLTEEKDWKPTVDVYDSITDCVIPTSTDVLAIFEECMTPYFSDEASYEESVENLRRKLELYVSE